MSPFLTRFSTRSIPEALTEIPQWVVWFPGQRHGKLTKLPYDPNSAPSGRLELASTSDPDTWSDYPTARRVAEETDHGIGLVLTADLGITGVDVDHCVEGRRITPWVRDLVRQLDTYAEVSPSRTGLRMFAYGDIPKALKRLEQGLELYKTGRFLTVTGRHIRGTSPAVEERSASIAALYEAFAPPEPPPRRRHSSHCPSLSDSDLIAKVSESRQGAKFTALFGGHTAGFGSASEADMSLACILCWWTEDDAQVEAVMRASGLAREKYRRPDYLTRTIARARSRVR